MILLPAIFKIIPCIDWGIAFFGILIEIADHLRPKKGLNTGLQSLGILGNATISCWEGSTPKGIPRPGVGHGEY